MAEDQDAPTLGGVPVEITTAEAIKGIPKNKPLLVMDNLNQYTPERPQPAVRCRTIEEVFRNFKPGKEIEFLMEDGNPCKEPFEFKKVSDFKKEGIIAQSQLLKGLVQKKELLQQIIKLLKTNDRLRKTLNDKTTKENILLVLQALMQKLTEAE